MALEPTLAAVAAGGVVLAVILLWKLAKLAVKVALVVAAAILLFVLAQQAGLL